MSLALSSPTTCPRCRATMRSWALESRRALGAPLDSNVIRMMRACLSIAIIWRDGPCIHTADLTHFPTGAPFGADRRSAEEPGSVSYSTGPGFRSSPVLQTP